MSRSRDIADSTKTLDVDGGTIKLDGNYPVGTGNVALGNTALDSIQSDGNYNVAIGEAVLTNVNGADANTAVGYQAGYSNTTGTRMSALGYQALYANTTGNYNTAMGYAALDANTTASYNTALGHFALSSLVGGGATLNTAIGSDAMANTTTGANNVAVGSSALAANTTASNNTAVGYQSLYSNTTGAGNVAIGDSALLNCTTGVNNTAIGYTAGRALTSGSQNTFIGPHVAGVGAAGYSMTTGSKNTILGGYNGNQGGLDIRTSSNNIVLSDGDGNPRLYIDSSGRNLIGQTASAGYAGGAIFQVSQSNANWMTSLSNSATSGAAYCLSLYFSGQAPNNTASAFLAGGDTGAERFRIYSNGNIVNQNNSYGALSDQKLKENVVDSGSQWEDIKALTVRKYSLKADNLDAPNMLGVIAQEVEAAGMGGLVFESPDKDADLNDLGTVTKQVNYSILYMKAVKALQEAMTRIETLETQNASFEARITALEGA